MTYYAYVSLQGDDKISRFVMDAASGSLEKTGDTPVMGGPAPLTISPDRTSLYVGQRNSKQLSSFAIDVNTGDLSPTGHVDVGEETCFMSTDKTGKYLLSAYYQAGYCAVHPISETGSLGGDAIEWVPTNSGAHCFQTDPSNRYAFLPHIAEGSGGLLQLAPEKQAAINAIFLYKFDVNTGHIVANNPARISPNGQDGPRHFCFHPTKAIVYFSNEQGGSVTAYDLDTDTGLLNARQTVTTLPEGYSGRNSCSQIQIHPDGKFLYVPNRGHNTVASFIIDEVTGELTATGWTSSDPVPRAFTVDPTGNFMFVGGLDTGNLLGFRIDQELGTLTQVAKYEVGNTPMWVIVIEV